MPTTYTSDCRFIMKELGAPNGATWALECYSDIKMLPLSPPNGSLYIRFKEATTEEQAKAISELLNTHVENLTYLG